MKHEHNKSCVVTYEDGKGKTAHRSAHGTPTAIPRGMGKRTGQTAQYCGLHLIWEPQYLALSEAHR